MRKVTRTHFEDEDEDMVRAAERTRRLLGQPGNPAAKPTGSCVVGQEARVPACSPVSCVRPQQVAHSTCGDGEYNLRSRTVLCGSCGLPSDKSSNCSVSSASRSYRSGGLSEGLLPQSYVFSTSSPRKVAPAAATRPVCTDPFRSKPP